MLSDTQRGQLSRQLMAMRIIVGALCTGALFFAVFVLVIRRPVVGEPRLAYAALLLAVGGVIAAAIVPRQIGKRAGKLQADTSPSLASDDLSQVLGVYQTRLILSLAILDAAVLFNLVAYMIEGQVVNVAVALVILTLMLIQFPSRTRTEHWVVDQLQAAKRGE